MSVTTPETFIYYGGSVDSEGTAGNARIVASLADMGYTGTLTAASGGTPAYVKVTLPTSTWDCADLERLTQFAKSINARFRYTKAS